jgi:antitoxin HigA-1
VCQFVKRESTGHLACRGQRAITGDTALNLAHFFVTSAEFWLNLQSLHDLRIARKKAGPWIADLPRLQHSERIPA